MKREAGADDFELVVAMVERCRARLRLVACVRSICAASLIAVVALEILVAAGLAAATHLSTVAIAGALPLLAVALVLGVARTPASTEAAARLDRRLSARNAVDTAFACAGNRDAVATLVAREAVGRLRDVHPAVLFPFELPRGVHALIAAAVIVPVMASLTTGGLRRVFDAGRSPRITGPAGPNIATADKGAAGGSAPTAATLAAATVPGTDAPRPSGAAPVSTVAERSPGRDLERRAGTDRRPDERSTGRGNAGGSTNASGGTDGTGTSAGRTVGGTATRQADAAGGAAGASLTLAAARAPQTAPWQSDRGYRAAWQKTQAPMAQERVPVQLRGYVKRYFTAIRPEVHE